ncbi:MAG: hypothetical protein GXP01_07180 [Alphaproteobacteria bacterium]|nr:hypothetical protein [Alphaproteobacteria bacterium]
MSENTQCCGGKSAKAEGAEKTDESGSGCCGGKSAKTETAQSTAKTGSGCGCAEHGHKEHMPDAL